MAKIKCSTGSQSKPNAQTGVTVLSRLKNVREVSPESFWLQGDMEIPVDRFSDDVHLMERGKQPSGEDDKVSLSRTVYDRAASSAGLTVLSRRLDNAQDPNIAHFEAVAVTLGVAGMIRLDRSESLMKISDFEDEVRAALDKQVRREGGLIEWQIKRDESGHPIVKSSTGKPEWHKALLREGTPEYEAQYKHRLDLRVRMKRVHLAAHCETRACKRVVKRCLGLRGTYTRRELILPLTIVVTVLNHDRVMRDPQLKAQLATQLLAGPQQIFSSLLGLPKVAAENLVTGNSLPHRLQTPAEVEETPGEYDLPDENGSIIDEEPDGDRGAAIQPKKEPAAPSRIAKPPLPIASERLKLNEEPIQERDQRETAHNVRES